jgi:hypothetical protein
MVPENSMRIMTNLRKQVVEGRSELLRINLRHCNLCSNVDHSYEVLYLLVGRCIVSDAAFREQEIRSTLFLVDSMTLDNDYLNSS